MKNQNSKAVASRKAEYEMQTVKQLLEVAKCFKITGRHSMSKAELINAIIASENVCKSFSERLNVNTNPVTENSTEEVVEAVEVEIEVEEKENANNMNASAAANTNESVNINQYATKIGKESKRSQDDYIDAIQAGVIVAFKTETRVLSAMVEEVYENNNGNVTELYCKSRNGIEYRVPRAAIIWVKTGNRWPRGIFEQLKGKKKVFYDFSKDD